MLALLLLLGGKGSRFNSPLPKQFVLYQGKAIFAATASVLLNSLPITHVVLAVAPEYLTADEFLLPLQQLQESYPFVPFHAVAGGSSRHLSFRAAFTACQQLNPNLKKILVHDANRPFLSAEFLVTIQAQLPRISPEVPCLIPVLALSESICRSSQGTVVAYEDRDTLFKVQTPQLLWGPAVAAALQSEAAKQDHWTDEGSFMLAAGKPVFTFAGDANNVKITYPQDLPTGTGQ